MAMPLAAKRKQFVSSQRAVARQVEEVRKHARETAGRISGTRKEQRKSLLECVARKRLEESIASNSPKGRTCSPHECDQSRPDYCNVVLSDPHEKRIQCLQTHTLAFLEE